MSDAGSASRKRPDTSARPAAPRAITPVRTSTTAAPASDAPTVCERCGADMYRMHAVWRCPSCGFKTDCCGW